MPTRIDNLTPRADEVIGLDDALAAKADASSLSSHTGATDNPHEVTASQVGAYTTGEVDGLIGAITYSDVGAAAASHTHDDRYYTETETDTLLSGKLSRSAASPEAGMNGPLYMRGNDIHMNDDSGEGGGWIDLQGGKIFNGVVEATAFTESGQPLRERYQRHFLDLESKSDLATLPATIGDQATVETGVSYDPIHRYELMGDDLDGETYATPAENLANWRRIVALDADEEIKGPIINRLVLDTDDTDVARIGEIVCVVDDLDEPTTVSYRMGDGTTKTESLPEIATVTP